MFREHLDRRIEKRLEQVLEPRVEEWLHRFFRTEQGQALISEVTADFLLSWLVPGNAKGTYFQKTLLQIIQQLATTDSEFRQEVIAALNPGWSREPNGGDKQV